MSYPLSSGVSLPFQQYAQHVTQRLRSQAHAQSYAQLAAARHRRRRAQQTAGPAFAAAAALREQCQLHRATLEPRHRAAALAALAALPLPSADDDPHFTVALQALRAAAYLASTTGGGGGGGGAAAPKTYAALNHLTRHAFLLDGHNVGVLCRALPALRLPEAPAALAALAPRVRQLLAAGDVTAAEAAVVARTYARLSGGGGDSAAAAAAAGVLEAAAAALAVGAAAAASDRAELREVLAVVPLLPTAEARARVVAAAAAALAEALDDGVVLQRAAHAGLCDALRGAAETADATAPPTAETHAELRQARALFAAAGAALRSCAVRGAAPCPPPLPLPLLAAYARAALAHSEPLWEQQQQQQRQGEEEAAEAAALRAAVPPPLTVREMGVACRALHACAYPHRRAARVLAGRAAAALAEETAPSSPPPPSAGSAADAGGRALHGAAMVAELCGHVVSARPARGGGDTDADIDADVLLPLADLVDAAAAAAAAAVTAGRPHSLMDGSRRLQSLVRVLWAALEALRLAPPPTSRVRAVASPASTAVAAAALKAAARASPPLLSLLPAHGRQPGDVYLRARLLRALAALLPAAGAEAGAEAEAAQEGRKLAVALARRLSRDIPAAADAATATRHTTNSASSNHRSSANDTGSGVGAGEEAPSGAEEAMLRAAATHLAEAVEALGISLSER